MGFSLLVGFLFTLEAFCGFVFNWKIILLATKQEELCVDEMKRIEFSRIPFGQVPDTEEELASLLVQQASKERGGD